MLLEKSTMVKFDRDPTTGLVNGIEYSYNDEGLIDWRAMVRPEDLVVNREYFKKKGKTDEEIDKFNIVDLPDSQKLILLAGLKRLARLRGYNYLKYTPIRAEPQYVSIICEIEYIPNFETSGRTIKFQSIANASLDNVSGDFQKYLETIAENRSFARCIRNFLGIDICSKEEIIASDSIDNNLTPNRNVNIPVINTTDPKSILQQKVADLNWSFSDFHEKIKLANQKNIEHNKEMDSNGIKGRRRTVIDGIDNWKHYDDIPINLIFLLTKKVDDYKIELKKNS